MRKAELAGAYKLLMDGAIGMGDERFRLTEILPQTPLDDQATFL